MDIQPKSKPVSVDAPALPFSPQSAALSLISSSPIIPNSTRATVASVSGFASPVRRSTGFQTAKSPSVVVSPSKVADVPHINLSVSADMALSALAFSAPVTVQSLSIDAPIYAVTPPLPSLPSETVSHPTLPVVPADDNPDNRLAALLDRIAIGKPKANEKPLSTDTKTSMFSAFLDRLSGEKSGSSVESVSVSESAQQMVHSVHVEARAAVAAPVPVRASSASFIDSTPGTGHLSPQLIDVPVRQTPSPGGLGFDSTEQMKRAGAVESAESTPPSLRRRSALAVTQTAGPSLLPAGPAPLSVTSAGASRTPGTTKSPRHMAIHASMMAALGLSHQTSIVAPLSSDSLSFVRQRASSRDSTESISRLSASPHSASPHSTRPSMRVVSIPLTAEQVQQKRGLAVDSAGVSDMESDAFSSPSTSGLNSPAPELVTAPQPYPRIGRSASLRRSSLQHPNLSITIAQRAYSHQGLHEHATEHNTAANTLSSFASAASQASFNMSQPVRSQSMLPPGRSAMLGSKSAVPIPLDSLDEARRLFLSLQEAMHAQQGSPSDSPQPVHQPSVVPASTPVQPDSNTLTSPAVPTTSPQPQESIIASVLTSSNDVDVVADSAAENRSGTAEEQLRNNPIKLTRAGFVSPAQRVQRSQSMTPTKSSLSTLLAASKTVSPPAVGDTSPHTISPSASVRHHSPVNPARMFTNAPHNLRAAVLTNNAHLRAGSSPAPSRSNSIIDKSFEKSVEKSFEKSVDKSAETNSPVNRSRSPSVSAGHVSPQVQTPPTQTTPSKMPATPVQYAVPFAQQFLIFLPARPQSIQSDSVMPMSPTSVSASVSRPPSIPSSPLAIRAASPSHSAFHMPAGHAQDITQLNLDAQAISGRDVVRVRPHSRSRSSSITRQSDGNNETPEAIAHKHAKRNDESVFALEVDEQSSPLTRSHNPSRANSLTKMVSQTASPVQFVASQHNSPHSSGTSSPIPTATSGITGSTSGLVPGRLSIVTVTSPQITAISSLESVDKPKKRRSFRALSSNEIKVEPELSVCRICEEKIAAADMPKHSEWCLQVARVEATLVPSDQALDGVLSRVEKRLSAKWSEMFAWERLLWVRVTELVRSIRSLRVGADKTQLTTAASALRELKIFLASKSSRLPRFIIDTLSTIDTRCTLKHEAVLQCVRQLAAQDHPSSTPKLLNRHDGKVSIADFDIVKPISRGAFGVVYLAQKRSTGDFFALKVLKKSEVNARKNFSHVRAEKQILSTTSSQFVVKLFFSFQTKTHLYLVLEYMPGGDCFSLLRSIGCLPCDDVRRYAADIVLALEYLHSNGIVHRDLKPDNLLVAADGHLKLTDFGLSRVDESPDSSNNVSRFVGTPDYVAPEILSGEGHDTKADVWSLGCVLFEFLFGTPPFTGETREEIFSKILASDISWASLPVDELQIETAVIELLQLLLQRDPISRPAVSDMKSHSFFASIDWMTHSSSPGVFIPTLDSATDTSYFDARAEHYPVMDQSDDNPVTPTNVQWSARGTSTLMQLLGTTPVGGGTLSALPFTPLNQTVGSLGLAGTPGTHFADFSFTALATLHEHNLLQARRLQLDSSDNLEETRSESSDPSDVDSQTGEMITGELITPVAGASSAFISDRLLRFDSPLLSPLNRSSSGSTGLLNGPLAGPLAGPLGSKLNVTSRIDEVDEAEFENSETSSSPSGRSISDQSPSDKTLSDPSVADLLAATSWHDVQSMLHHPTIKPTREAVSNALHSFQSQPPNSPPTQSSSPTTHSSLSKHSVGRSVDSSSPPNGDSAAVPESWRARALRWQRQHRHVDRLNADPNERTVDVVLNAVELLDDADELVEI